VWSEVVENEEVVYMVGERAGMVMTVWEGYAVHVSY
jgi:hypothetical protein